MQNADAEQREETPEERAEQKARKAAVLPNQQNKQLNIQVTQVRLQAKWHIDTSKDAIAARKKQELESIKSLHVSNTTSPRGLSNGYVSVSGQSKT